MTTPRLPTPALRRRGFTLVEAMMATVLFTMLTLGVYATLIKSYQMIALCRARDQARAVLRTYADQFQRLQITVNITLPDDPGTVFDESTTKVPSLRWLFLPSGGPTSRGLRWGAMSDQDASVNIPIPSPVDSLPITLGAGAHAIGATVTRNVRYVDAATGANESNQSIRAAGYLLACTFEIRYRLVQSDYVQTMTVMRAAP